MKKKSKPQVPSTTNSGGMGDRKQKNKKKVDREHRRADPPSGQSAEGGCSGSVGVNFSDGSGNGTSVSLQGDGARQSGGMPGLFSSSSTQTGGPAFPASVSEEAEGTRRSRVTDITPRLFSPRASSSPLMTRSRRRKEGEETETGKRTQREIGHGTGRQDRGRFLSDDVEGRRKPATVPCGQVFTRQTRCRRKISGTEGAKEEAAASSPPTRRRDRDTARLSREETGIPAGLWEGGGGKRKGSAMQSLLPAAGCLSDSGRGGSDQVGDGGTAATAQAHGEEQKEEKEKDDDPPRGDRGEEYGFSASLLFLLPSRPQRTAVPFPPPTTRARAKQKREREGMQLTGGRKEGLRPRRTKEGGEGRKDCQRGLSAWVNANGDFRQLALPKKRRGTTLQSGDGDPFETPALDSPLYDDRFSYPRIRCEGKKEEIGLVETDIDDAIPIMQPPHTEAFFDSETMLNEQGGGEIESGSGLAVPASQGGGGGGQPSVSPSPLPSPSQVPSPVVSSRSRAKKEKEGKEREAGKGRTIEEEIDRGEDGEGASASSSSSSAPPSFLSPNRVEEEREERNEYCEHGLEKRLCAHCGENSVRKEGKNVLCPHGRNEHFCKRCGGEGSCNHKHNKSNCTECGRDGFCMHGRRKCKCKECGRCRHGRKKDFCALCEGAQMSAPECKHGLLPSLCRECSAAKRQTQDHRALPRYPHSLGVSNPGLSHEEQDNRKKNLKKRTALQEVRGNEKKARGDEETGQNANGPTESHRSNSHTNSRKSNPMVLESKENDREKGDTSAVRQKRKRGKEAVPPPPTAPDPSPFPRQSPVSPAGPTEPIAVSQARQQTGRAASVAAVLMRGEMVIWQGSEEAGRRFLGRVIRAHSRRNQVEVHVWGSSDQGLLRTRVFAPMWQSRDGTRPVYRHDRPPSHRPHTCVVPLNKVVERGISLTQDSKLPPSSVSAHRAAFSQIGEDSQLPLHERGAEREVERRRGGEKRRRKEAIAERETHTQKRKKDAGTAETENRLPRHSPPKKGKGPQKRKKFRRRCRWW
uniref:Uncharacterized protein n=1 Tax=Chromera velia CCMP2878 TaxID=1169474 RepID=A0A0G4GM88_9ALVE|eukprot:Cvel_22509.t1-p1 / transcript=Cvel_22509.t1 / gene=Cvel_22509 / organism=Chromera_velia_CCMP2878 / gene_product=hypothetical protein / transcript_product=hypothetical protein / location=Cvel_scaffold2219:465-4119(+) / protein_length=1032 / sequence_SO=supercontig / SO=protein_coding / is_pseudo=false